MERLLQADFLSQLQQLDRRGACDFFLNCGGVDLRQVTLLFDCSQGMQPMIDEAKQSAAAIAWLALRRNLNLRIIPFSAVPQLGVPVFRGPDDYRRLITALDSFALGGRGDLYKCVAEAKSHPQNITIIISDMLSADERLFELLASQGGRSIIIHTFEPSLFIAPAQQFSAANAAIYDTAGCREKVLAFMGQLENMSAPLQIPLIRVAKADGWLHLAYYLFHCSEYRRVS